MADAGAPLNEPRPLLAFPPPDAGPIPPRESRPPFRPVRRPGAGRQGIRLTPQFRSLRDALEQDRAQLVDTTTAPDPELVAVFDLAGTVERFVRAAAGIDGLEFLADLQEDRVEPDEEFFYEEEGEPSDDEVPQSLYMVMTNAQAVGELVRLFELWQEDQSVTFERGLAPLKEVFALLRRIRRWGPEDRVRETGLLDQWAEDVEVVGAQGTSRVEIELWYRNDPVIRQAAQDEVVSLVQRLDGEVIRSAHRAEIAYHGVLADIPMSHVQRALDEGPEAIELLTAERIMLVSPSLPMAFPSSEPVAGAAPPFDVTLPIGLPRVALLDGVPMANHDALANRLIIDDPDDRASRYVLAQRNHGSAMSSLIMHGDLSAPGESLRQPLYVRPIFEPHPHFARTEVVPPDELLVDLVHRAFHRVLEGDGDDDPAAPSVRVFCLAVGDPARAFVRRLSPLARLLDWLAATYNVVIIVSGGNVDGRPAIDLEDVPDGDQRHSAVMRSLHERARYRRLLAPAEAINALTVGALHTDQADVDLPDTVLDVVAPGFPASYSPVGYGYRRSVKPDVLLPGGRQVFRAPPPGGTGLAELTVHDNPAVGPGLAAAAPGMSGETDAISYSCGTSNATALAARTVSQIFDLLEELRHEDGEFPFPDPQYHPVLAKALLVHAAGWHDELPRLGDLLRLSGQQVRRELTRILGYGVVHIDRATSAASHRVLLLGAGSIERDQRQTFQFPLPDALSSSTEWRRLTITLGWFSPVNVHSQKYRMARLRFSATGDDLAVTPSEADSNAVLKGTVQHQVLQGAAATGYANGSALSIDVDCRVDAGTSLPPIRYGLAASLEVGPAVRSDIHADVRTRLREQVRERARVPTR